MPTALGNALPDFVVSSLGRAVPGRLCKKSITQLALDTVLDAFFLTSTREVLGIMRQVRDAELCKLDHQFDLSQGNLQEPQRHVVWVSHQKTHQSRPLAVTLLGTIRSSTGPAQ